MLNSLLSNSRRQQFFNLLFFYAAYLWFRSFSTSVLGPHFLENDISLAQMILGSFWFFLAGSLCIILYKTYSSRNAWQQAIVLSIIAILIVVKVDHVWQFYLYSFILGLGNVLFFIPYNIAHFRLTPSHRTSFSSGIMFSVYPIIALIAPLAAGWLAEINYAYIWYGSIIFFFISLSLVKFQARFTFNFNLKHDLIYLKPTWLIVIFQGLWEPIIFGVIPVFTLNFIQTPLAFGTYFSYLGLVAILANLFLGRLSDKLNRRLRFLIPTTILIGVGTMMLPLATSKLIFWLIITGMIEFLVPLFWNFSTAYFVDRQPDNIRSMPAREWLLSVSRMIGFLLVFFNFYFQTKPTMIFYLLGGVMLLYPAVLIYNTRHAARS